MLVVDDVLIDRMVQIENENLRSRIARMAGVHVQRFGAALAFVAPSWPTRFFNSVLGTCEATLEHLDEIEALYRAHGLTPTFEVVPSRMTEALGLALAWRGYAMVEFHAGLACRPTVDASPTSVRVDEVPFDAAFAELYAACWEERTVTSEGGSWMHWQHNYTWRFFVAFVDGLPAAAAILDVRGTTALLGSAGTLPSRRGRGLQQALIARRVTEAASAGCDLLVGGAYFGTTSMRNQQRAGLEVAFTRGIWVARQSPHGSSTPSPVPASARV